MAAFTDDTDFRRTIFSLDSVDVIKVFSLLFLAFIIEEDDDDTLSDLFPVDSFVFKVVEKDDVVPAFDVVVLVLVV